MKEVGKKAFHLGRAVGAFKKHGHSKKGSQGGEEEGRYVAIADD